MSERIAIQLETLTRLADGFRESRGISNNLTTEQMIALAQEPIKPEQEKTVDITKNGATEIFPDEGYVLSKVTANVNVSASGENKFAQLVGGTLTKLTAEDLQGATIICKNAFYQNQSITDIELPNTVTSIEESAFYNSKLTNITLPNGLISIGYVALKSTAITKLIIPDSVTSLGSQAFSSCGKLTDVKLSKNLTEISNNLFSYSGLPSITIPNNIKSIDSSAFSNCNNLKTVRIGNGITSISHCFSGCPALTDIYIDAPEGSISGSPWGASSATIHWNTPLPTEGE